MPHNFEKETDGILDSIILYIQSLPETLNPEQTSDISERLQWINDYFSLYTNKEYLHSKELPYLKRGNVVLVKFGENFGMEFSGDHPAVVLRNCRIENDQVLILPLTTKKPKAFDPKKEGIYLEFKKINGLKGFQDKDNANNPDNGKHWANILNVKSISKSRILYPPDQQNIDGKYLTMISSAICSHVALEKK